MSISKRPSRKHGQAKDCKSPKAERNEQTCSGKVPSGRVSTLRGQVEDGQTEVPAQMVRTVWPEFLHKSGRLDRGQAISPGSKLIPLKCIGWELVSNPEFNHLTLTLKPGTGRTAEKWLNYFCRLGRDMDVIIEAAEFSGRLHRPLCTYGDKHILERHYQTARVRALQH